MKGEIFETTTSAATSMCTTSSTGEVVASAARAALGRMTDVVSKAIMPIRGFMIAPWVGLLLNVGFVVVLVLSATWGILCFGPKAGVRGRWSPLVLALILLAAMCYLLVRARR